MKRNIYKMFIIILFMANFGISIHSQEVVSYPLEFEYKDIDNKKVIEKGKAYLTYDNNFVEISAGTYGTEKLVNIKGLEKIKKSPQ